MRLPLGVFLGANQDAVAAGEAIGASGANSAAFDVADMRDTFTTLSDATRTYRSGQARRSGTFWSGGRPRQRGVLMKTLRGSVG